jgi:hypothetical protein
LSPFLAWKLVQTYGVALYFVQTCSATENIFALDKNLTGLGKGNAGLSALQDNLFAGIESNPLPVYGYLTGSVRFENSG